MSTEPNNQATNSENLNEDHWNAANDDVLRTKVESQNVVNFIENMVQAMGSVAAEQYGAVLPQPIRRPQETSSRKYQSKAIGSIMQKLERIEKYPDLHKQVADDDTVKEWLGRSGCKQKEYFEELECAQELTSFFGGHRYFPQAIQAASKAVAITMLHRRDDEETLAEAYWVLAELYAATDNMDKSLESMRKCLELIEPGAAVGHPTYNELLAQLEDTRKRNLLVATV